MSLTARSDAERMDRHYRFQRHIYDATRSRYLIGRRHLIADVKPGPGDTILEIGCGTAWNLIRIARRYPDARVFGVDVSNAMLETARASIRRHGLSSRITLAQADATDFDAARCLGQPVFDRVVFSYALSMIPGWRRALHVGAAHIAPGGRLHIVDFGQCQHLPHAFKNALFTFLDHYTVTPRSDLDAAIARVAAQEGMTSSIVHLHRGYTDYAILSRSR